MTSTPAFTPGFPERWDIIVGLDKSLSHAAIAIEEAVIPRRLPVTARESRCSRRGGCHKLQELKNESRIHQPKPNFHESTFTI
jgi:hypothetical protein